MKRALYSLAAAALLLAAPALVSPAFATSTTTDTQNAAGPVKTLLHCFTSGANSGRCVTPTVLYDADGNAYAASGSGGSTSDPNNAPFAGVVAMTVGTSYAAQRSIGANCTAAGNMSVTFSDASTLVVPVQVGFQTFPFAVTAVNTSDTTATCTYVNLK